MRKFVHITMFYESCNAAYFQRFSVVLGHFPKASCAKHLLVTKSSFLRKWASTLVLGIFNIPQTNRIKDNTVTFRYIFINFDRKFNRKKPIIYFFLGTKRREPRNILKALHVSINSFFKLLVILLIIIADDLKGERLFWTTAMVFTKVCSFR